MVLYALRYVEWGACFVLSGIHTERLQSEVGPGNKVMSNHRMILRATSIRPCPRTLFQQWRPIFNFGLASVFSKFLSSACSFLHPNTNTASRTTELRPTICSDGDFSFTPTENVCPLFTSVRLPIKMKPGLDKVSSGTPQENLPILHPSTWSY